MESNEVKGKPGLVRRTWRNVSSLLAEESDGIGAKSIYPEMEISVVSFSSDCSKHIK